MRRRPTGAEREFRNFLNGLNNGVLRGKFKEQHIVSGKWIVDFFFPEIRLAIEIDGSVHRTAKQQSRDIKKQRTLAGLILLCADLQIPMFTETRKS